MHTTGILNIKCPEDQTRNLPTPSSSQLYNPQSLRTARLVGRLGGLHSAPAFNDLQQEFVLQIKHEAFAFSAGGFFDINMGLLTTVQCIVGFVGARFNYANIPFLQMIAVTMANILVLLQFQDSEMEGDNKLYSANPVKDM